MVLLQNARSFIAMSLLKSPVDDDQYMSGMMNQKTSRYTCINIMLLNVIETHGKPYLIIFCHLAIHWLWYSVYGPKRN